MNFVCVYQKRKTTMKENYENQKNHENCFRRNLRTEWIVSIFFLFYEVR